MDRIIINKSDLIAAVNRLLGPSMAAKLATAAINEAMDWLLFNGKAKSGPNHASDETDECPSWCPACGPACKHGKNEFECEYCGDLFVRYPLW